MSKLDDIKVVLIRESYASGGITMAELASCFQVTKTTISFVIKRKIWVHL